MRLRRHIKACAGALSLFAAAFGVQAEDGYSIDYSAEAILNAGNGDFAPYYIASNRHGVITQSKNALLRVSAMRDMNLSERFSYGFGVDFIGEIGRAHV